MRNVHLFDHKRKGWMTCYDALKAMFEALSACDIDLPDDTDVKYSFIFNHHSNWDQFIPLVDDQHLSESQKEKLEEAGILTLSSYNNLFIERD